MRVFKNKWFNHWASREGISDDVLFGAAKEIIIGNVEANLGGYLFKKRLPRQGKGKSGGYRVIVGFKKQNNDRIIYLYGFSKSQAATISKKEEAALKIVSSEFVAYSDEQISRLIQQQYIMEVLSNE